MSKQVQAQRFSLSGSGVSASATSIELVTLATPDGTAITMTDFGNDVGYATMEPSTSREESISFTGITGTTLTGVSRGLRFVSPFDVVAGNKKTHAGGTILVFSNTSAFYSRFVDDFNAQTIGGVKTFSSIPVLPASNPTTDNQATRKAYVDGLDVLAVHLAGTETITGVKTFTSTARPKYNTHPTFVADEELIDKKYADDLAIAGAPDASTTVKGIVEIATQAEVDAGTDTGGTSATLVVIPSTFQTGLSAAFPLGDGSDGNVTISSPTTLTRDMYYNDLVINSTLTTDGYLVFVKGTVSGSGTLTWGTANPGGAGGNSVASGTSTAGAGAAASGTGKLRNLGGASGGTNSSGGSNGGSGSSVGTAAHTIGPANVAGGNGAQDGGAVNSGGAGGATIRTPNVETKFAVFGFPTFKMFDVSETGTFTPYVSGFGGNGGGAGASRSTDSGGAGGGGGASGGIVALFVKTWAGTFTIQAKGGTGGAGGNGTAGTFGGGAGGGGAGGAGGVAIVVYGTKTWTGSYDIGGGAGGAAGGVSSNAATAGSTGAAGISFEKHITSLTR